MSSMSCPKLIKPVSFPLFRVCSMASSGILSFSSSGSASSSSFGVVVSFSMCVPLLEVSYE